ncbi:MAG: 4-(cytidine 5'-diphospho)-2-C-methyl-D-erythritol kinase [Proteobacteria bacterium]|nr:4-(cytidine 5'-diphospho)-2-C-methyl-D-erythritol kinase [Pseudomonadota bacterium]
MRTYKSFCPAKINLFLKVVGKRVDGFHELESLFVFTDLVDELEVSLSDNFALEISGDFARFVDQENNLFVKIINFFVQEFAVTKNIKIRIVKNIPVGSGLGGGSSNAAYFIRALNEIFALNLDKKSLQKISLKFGSDIPFFFEEQASIVTGRGEIIENFPEFKPISALLIHPKISLGTKDIFQKLAGNFSQKIGSEKLKKMSIEDFLILPNDLQQSAISTVLIIGEIIDHLEKFGADFAKMSGSGSACFGVFSSEEKILMAEKKMFEKFPDFFCKRISISWKASL